MYISYYLFDFLSKYNACSSYFEEIKFNKNPWLIKTHNILFNLELLDYSSDVYGEILKRQSSYIFLPIMYGKKPIINVYKYILNYVLRSRGERESLCF